MPSTGPKGPAAARRPGAGRSIRPAPYEIQRGPRSALRCEAGIRAAERIMAQYAPLEG